MYKLTSNNMWQQKHVWALQPAVKIERCCTTDIQKQEYSDKAKHTWRCTETATGMQHH